MSTPQQPAPTPSRKTLTDEEKIKRIVAGIRDAERRVRERFPILRHQNAIGLAILLVSLAGMIGSGALYALGVWPAWATIAVSAIFASLSHELEHDLIHYLYFRKNRVVRNLMMFAVWAMRPNTVNPWYRRRIHLLHHKVSGTHEDVEERLVGNGVRYGLLRFIVMADGLLGMLLRVRTLNSASQFNFKEVMLAAFPLTTLYFGLWYLFLGYHAADAVAGWAGLAMTVPAWGQAAMQWVDLIVVLLIAPNFLRSFCLNFITSNMHYYGGVSSLLQQTQILKPWFLFPLQVFCCNFGSTHAIHHFVVGQPFYLRQMVARAAHRVMREYGVRYNDLTTFIANNRYLPRPSLA